MKRLNWVLIGVVVFCLAIIPLLGGCVSKSEFDALQAKYATLTQEKVGLEGELGKLQTDYTVVSKELTEIKKVYPPKDFASYSALSEWSSKHI